MREKRNGLRPVTINERGSVVKGYLLHIGIAGDLQDGIDQVALIEHEDGGVSQWSAYNLQFDDVD